MGTILVRRVDTFKYGPFYFSTEIDEMEISKVLVEANILFQTVNDLPILPEMASSLDEDLISRSIFGTAAIEGNPLGEEDVRNLLYKSSERRTSRTSERAKQEILNLSKAYEIVAKITSDDIEITEDLIKNIHYTLTHGIEHKDNIPGKYRNHLVKVGNPEHGGVHTPPKIIDDIRNLMKEFITWINSPEVTKLDHFVQAALAHYHFSLIHPFGDGNGRTARLLESIILHSAGIKYVPIMLSNFYYRNVDDYYWAFSNTIKAVGHDTSPFVKFCLTGAVESLKEIKETITWFIRKLTLRDYYNFLRQKKGISQRQHDLLSLLLDYGSSFTHQDLHTEEPFRILYRKVSTRTSTRDLKKLTLMDILIAKDKVYSLNLKMLG